MKKRISLLLAASLLSGAFVMGACNQKSEPVKSTMDEAKVSPVAFETKDGLYVHALSGSDDTQAWHLWQSVHDEEFKTAKPYEKYFFLPTSADEKSVDIYNGYAEPVTVNGVEIPSGATEAVSYTVSEPYDVKVKDETFSLRFMKSNAEAAVFINNSDADGKGTDLMTYLNDEDENYDKHLTATATGAILDSDGNIDNTPIKKIKGRGNTSWEKPKKSYNVNYESAVSVAGIKEGKKFCLVANYQDDSLSRNRILYDLSDAVGMPYASDSRYVDLYVNGFYWGSYQMCEKIDGGKNSLVGDIEAEGYLDANGKVKQDFPFLCEVDPGADYLTDYFTSTNSGKLSIKYPEVAKEEPGYNEVKDYVAEKYDAFYEAAGSDKNELSALADIDSMAKLYLVNELGKNWDSGVSSVFFVYKPDESGRYKFYASPVWDFDNTLGNAKGVESELNGLEVEDYEDYTGWWCEHKGGFGNIVNRLSQNPEVKAAAKRIWFEEFVPAIQHFSGEKNSEEINREFYSADTYYDLIHDSAEMNYTSGWLLKTGKWIADHDSLTKARFDEQTRKMVTESTAAKYQANFTDMFHYCNDWLTSRAAWLSQEFSKQ